LASQFLQTAQAFLVLQFSSSPNMCPVHPQPERCQLSLQKLDLVIAFALGQKKNVTEKQDEVHNLGVCLSI